jgi:uncharacterized RDD family membrane protein YckC
MEVIDQSFIDTRSRVRYGGFWIRLVALIIDGIALAPITFGLMYANIVSFKSPGILVLGTLIGVAYKPFMEYQYGATLGKMALNLKVVTPDLSKADLKSAILRNVFYFTPTLIALLFTLPVFFDGSLEDVDGYMEYSAMLGQVIAVQVVNVLGGIISIIDAIVLASDSSKRSIHDRLGNTLVIEKA